MTIEVEGSPANVAAFIGGLERDPPQLAQIVEVTISELATVGGIGFVIRESREEPGEFSLVPPDAGTCDHCWQDFGDPSNRRFGYPFTNCTLCGPRYTIIYDIPYDRPKTTMSAFTMCASCLAEYEDPLDRRFHAQPNACAVCGPSLCLLPGGSSPADCSFSEKAAFTAIHKARQLLHEGNILAVKGLGGFLLA